MSKEYYACRCKVDTCRNPTGGALRKTVLNLHLWILEISDKPFKCPDCKYTFIPGPVSKSGGETILVEGPFSVFGIGEDVPDDLQSLQNPFQRIVHRYRYPCHCTTNSVSDAAAHATGGWLNGIRYWNLEPSHQPFTCPDCGDSFVPFPPTVPGEKDPSLRRPLRNDTKQAT